ncbi:MAG: TonB C-terminal domain-containing protein [Candidatus Aminicenantes bacterium]|nr:MAG: TonB C-terminal domain-containing protein [Candidatus Aminicenantes bacterium]
MSFLASVLFHMILLFFLIKLVPPVRVYLFRHAADVRIVEPKMVSFPRIEGSSEVHTSGSPSPQISSEDLSVRGTEDRQQIAPNPGVVYLKNLNFGRAVEQTTESFDLIPSPKTEGRFSLDIGRKKPEHEEWVGEDTSKGLDFSRYDTPALSSLQFDRIITRKGRGEMDADVSDQLKGYDITPWVKQVVDKIHNNWTPPPIVESISLGKVKILIIIGKMGNLVSMGIVESSDFPMFDQTTTAAIRSSAPFPPLPVDFPSERLEAVLVFEFHE